MKIPTYCCLHFTVSVIKQNRCTKITTKNTEKQKQSSVQVSQHLFCWCIALSALTLSFWQQEGHPACKKQWWDAGVVICLEQGVYLHVAQLMPLPLTILLK